MLKRIKGYKEGNDILKSNLHVLAPNIWGTFLQYHSTRLRRRSIITRATRERVCGRVAAELLSRGGKNNAETEDTRILHNIQMQFCCSNHTHGAFEAAEAEAEGGPLEPPLQ